MKNLWILFILVMAFVTVGCSGSETPAENTAETESAAKAGEAAGDGAATTGRTEAGADFK